MSNLTYLSVFNAHSGEIVKIPKPIRYHKLSDFKCFLAESFGSDDTNSIFLLASFGIKLDFNIINELNDVYYFDKRLFAKPIGMDLYEIAEDEIPQPTAPDFADKPSNIKNISQSLKDNSEWSNSQYSNSITVNESIKRITMRLNVIFKSLNIIFQFATNFVNDVEKSFNSYYTHIKLMNVKSLQDSWEQHYKSLAKFAPFKISGLSLKLVDYLDKVTLQQKAFYIKEKLPLLIAKLNDMGSEINRVNELKLNVDEKIKTLRNESINIFKGHEAQKTFQQIERLTGLISKDIQKIQGNETCDLNEMYKSHRVNMSPLLFENLKSQRALYISLQEFTAFIVKESLFIFQNIARLQMQIVDVKSYIKELSDPGSINADFSYQTVEKIKDAENCLSLTIDLPLLFGFMMIEKRREFEWYDFFSKGVVNNASEQLTVIIEQERIFRRVWMKKFGTFLSLMGSEPLPPSLPNVDVTLLSKNGNEFPIIDNLNIEREDITNYISVLQSSNCSRNFIDLLHKNFDDLLRSTINMKRATKLISSLGTITSISNDDRSKVSKKDEEESEIDLNLMKELRSRIRKLESLLHQQQYRNLSSWPVTRNMDNSPLGGKSSAIVEKSGGDIHQSSVNPERQRQKQISSSPQSTSKVLDTSGIDRLVDNIKLKKEVTQLREEKESLSGSNRECEGKIKGLEKALNEQRRAFEAQEEQYKSKLDRTESELRKALLDGEQNESEIETLNKKVQSNDHHVFELETKISELNSSNKNKDGEIEELKNALEDATSIKDNLLSNMSSKEADVSKERSSLEDEIKTITGKLDEKTEDYENLLELMTTRQKTNDTLVNDLNNTIISLFKNVKKLIDVNFGYIAEFCLVLESMGLLLVRENEILKITRVKGLRGKKATSTGGVEECDTDVPVSGVVKEVEMSLDWSNDLSSVFSILPDNVAKSSSSYEGDMSRYSEQSLALIDIFKKDFSDQDSMFDNYLRLASFKEGVQFQEGSDHASFFLNAISKRFKDVEGYAKKQTKENKLGLQEMDKLTKKLNSRITMHHFQMNDLVLFLPTTTGLDGSDLDIQPWAAFNIGAPHYFLEIEDPNELKGKDWMIGRIKRIEEHHVPHTNTITAEENPFRLSPGISWFLIEATRETVM